MQISRTGILCGKDTQNLSLLTD